MGKSKKSKKESSPAALADHLSLGAFDKHFEEHHGGTKRKSNRKSTRTSKSNRTSRSTVHHDFGDSSDGDSSAYERKMKSSMNNDLRHRSASVSPDSQV